jgi:putative toxin-antitoxin system antitoxin component (TIGR02293 family)
METTASGQIKVKRRSAKKNDFVISSTDALIYQATPLERIAMMREGVSAVELIKTGAKMGVSKEKMFSLLHLPRSTVNRRIATKKTMSVEHSERLIGLQKLIGQVEIMVSESGDSSEFNAAKWVADWLERPVAALNNSKPADFMDTIEGIELISSMLAKMQSGAYA